jgi:serine/threonine protein kinase
LGTGGFGVVWAATGPDGSRAALKFLDCRNKPASVAAQEIRLLRRLTDLRHPNIIQLFGVGAYSHFIVLAMERADGSLRDLHDAYQAEAGENIPADLLLDLLEQAARALDFLAEAKPEGMPLLTGGLQHCDIKPSNLLLVGDCLKVADFGLCMASGTGSGKSFRGTPPYAAPELYEGRATRGTDQYALAVTYSELGLGRDVLRPPATTSPPGAEIPLFMSRIRARECPVVARALKKNWTERWPRCQDFIAALRRASMPSRRVPLVKGRSSSASSGSSSSREPRVQVMSQAPVLSGSPHQGRGR